MEKNLNHFYIPETNRTLQSILLQLNNKNKKMPGETVFVLHLTEWHSECTNFAIKHFMFYNLPIPPCSPHLKSSLNIPC